MNMPGKMPKFTAEASVYCSRAAYLGNAVGPRSGQGRAAAVQPAARRLISYCSMKGCCVDLRDLGYQRICCNGDECGPDVLI